MQDYLSTFDYYSINENSTHVGKIVNEIWNFPIKQIYSWIFFFANNVISVKDAKALN